MADVVVVVLLTEGAMHPSKVPDIITDRSPTPDLELVRDVPGSPDHLRLGWYYSLGSGYAGAQVVITASDGTLLAGIWEFPREGASKAVILCLGLAIRPSTTKLLFRCYWATVLPCSFLTLAAMVTVGNQYIRRSRSGRYRAVDPRHQIL
jgi:hypothetical protein